MNKDDLKKQGWLLAPGETEQGFNRRIKKFMSLELVSTPLLKKASQRVEALYGIRFEKAPFLESNKDLFPWQGGALWSVTEETGDPFPLVQIRKSSWLSVLYSKEELLSHELVHLARFAFKEPFFEEILAYKTSKSPFRRFLGPLFIFPAETTLFTFFALLSSVFLWLLPWLFALSVLFFMRLSFLQWVFFRAKKKEGLESLVRLSDKEIFSIGLKGLLTK